ncbi:hypothetical protein LEP1GSC082_2906 [Leptospira kirschneri str. H2]|uniref:Uncharacterized protein n=2 Tax=Leptospira kirschneri TaxID=29507 RepID=A0A0E2B105_9LEPT|nr:hypothetical protein LEP1GSC081_1549 [Leptospira kirschneri str. H1]EKO61041.1 hypothetical protein LEP1GSC082_2906 [Leptospira kirschneri str. H2]EMK25762.1 hypothetical protein LEP1GSC008_0293 [Leptospira kirschneri serovar Bulgarica str. Nikolaevo]
MLLQSKFKELLNSVEEKAPDFSHFYQIEYLDIYLKLSFHVSSIESNTKAIEA